MKKIAILLFAIISALSCSKDDVQTTPEPVANNSLKVFKVPSAFIAALILTCKVCVCAITYYIFF